MTDWPRMPLRGDCRIVPDPAAAASAERYRLERLDRREGATDWTLLDTYPTHRAAHARLLEFMERPL